MFSVILVQPLSRPFVSDLGERAWVGESFPIPWWSCPFSSDETSSGIRMGRFLYPSPQLEGFFKSFFFFSQLQSIFTFAVRVKGFSVLSPKALKFLFHVRKRSGRIFMPFLLRWPPFSFKPALPRAAYSGLPSCPQFFL